jgi:hypothetical protein
MLRVLGSVFAVLGPIILVFGGVLTARGHGGLLLRQHRPTGVMAVVYPIMVAMWLVRFWLPGGYLRAPWRAGRTLDRVLAITSTTTLIGFAAAWWTGFATLSTIALVASSLATMPLVLPVRTPRTDTPSEREDPEKPPPPQGDVR